MTAAGETPGRGLQEATAGDDCGAVIGVKCVPDERVPFGMAFGGFDADGKPVVNLDPRGASKYRRPPALLRWAAGWIEAALWTVEHYASEAADRVNQWRTL